MSVSASIRRKVHKSIQALEAEIDSLRVQLKAAKKGNGKPTLTQEQRREYLKDPNNCPYCESKHLTAGMVDIHTGGCSQPVKCDTCKRAWHDTYELVGVEEEK